jgi:hypothetical protein
MQHLNPAQLSQHAVRAAVCTHCIYRPPHSEKLSSSVARSCERDCAIFLNLNVLRGIAAADQRTPMADYEREITQRVCRRCDLSSTAGEYCVERLTCTCPLAMYSGEVLAALESLYPQRCGCD